MANSGGQLLGQLYARRVGAVAGAPIPRLLPSLTMNGLRTGGDGFIAGTTTVQGITTARIPVHLYERAGGQFVRSTRSDATGAYRFDGLDRKRKYIVLAVKPEADYNAVVADVITPGV